MQDTFARAMHSVGQARRATIGYLVYNVSLFLKVFSSFITVESIYLFHGLGRLSCEERGDFSFFGQSGRFQCVDSITITELFN